MKSTILLFFLALSPAVSIAKQNDIPQPVNSYISKPDVEFRIAQKTPREGLKEMKTLSGDTVYVSEKAVISNLHIFSIVAQVIDTGINYQITFNERGIKQFEKVTSHNLKKNLAFLVNGKVINAPAIVQAVKLTTPLTGGLDLKQPEATQLAKEMNGQ